jgi:ABC-type lipopolysaccharide export system ATPase subunit
VVVKGRVLVHGTPPEVISHPEARELYFGTGIDADIRRAG